MWLWPVQSRRSFGAAGAFFVSLAAIAGAFILFAGYIHWTGPKEQSLKIGEAPNVMGRILWVGQLIFSSVGPLR